MTLIRARKKRSDIYCDDIVIFHTEKDYINQKDISRCVQWKEVRRSVFVEYHSLALSQNESDLNNDRADNQQCWILFK